MEDDINLKEIAIILGLKNHSDDLNKIINDRKDLSFLGAISNILYSDKINNIYENNEQKESNDNEMTDKNNKKAEIDNICPVKLELYKNSNFVDNIKGNDIIYKAPNIDYSESYLSKLQKDFVKQENIIVPPIEIKQQFNEKNKKHQYIKQNTMPINNINKNKNSIQIENIEIAKKKSEIEFEKEEDKKEIKENNENKDNDIEVEEEEKYSEKKNEGNNNYHQNNNRPYNKKYNRNKTHKEYRQKMNNKKFKNYK